MATDKQSGPGGWSYEAIKALLQDRPVAYHPILAKKLGGVTTALFLSQILYWQDKGDDPEGWIHKSQQEIEEETGLTRFEQEGARKKLREHGVVEEKRFGLPARLHYRPKFEQLVNILGQKKRSGDANDDSSDSPDDNSGDGEQDDSGESSPQEAEGKNPCKIKNEEFPQTRVRNFRKLDSDKPANKDAEMSQSLYTSESTPESTTEKDLPSVGPFDAPAREGSQEDSETGPTDRLTDRPTDEEPSGKTSDFSTTAQLLEKPDTQHEEDQAPDLFPNEDADNATPKPKEALRQQVEAIPTSEVSEAARQLTGELLRELPALSERDQLRTVRLAEHYHRKERTSVLRIAASGVALYASQQRIRHPFSYLLACCVDAEGERSEGDEDLLASLSGENTSAGSAESESSGYKWFSGDSEQESDAGENQQRQDTPDPDPEAQEVWEGVLEDVSGEINAPSLRVWFEGTIPVSLSDDTLTISVPNSFAKEYIESRFKELLEEALAKHLSPTSHIDIVVEAEKSTNNTKKK